MIRKLSAVFVALIASGCGENEDRADCDACYREFVERAYSEQRLHKSEPILIEDVLDVGGALRTAIIHDGSLASVEGWLSDCDQYGCALVASEEAGREYGYGAGYLSIGSDAELDPVLFNAVGKKIRLRGRFDRSCIIAPGCLDRASEFQPIEIEHIFEDVE